MQRVNCGCLQQCVKFHMLVLQSFLHDMDNKRPQLDDVLAKAETLTRAATSDQEKQGIKDKSKFLLS